MTVGTKMHQALTMAESLKAQLEMFGLETEDQQVKHQFFQMAQMMEKQIIPQLKGRVNYIESQEPQYKVKQQAQQQAQQQGQSPMQNPPQQH
ncbi:MAG: DUF1657 domain-containing protein [Bacillota bacterium]